MGTRHRAARRVAALAGVGLAVVVYPTTARAFDWTLKAEPGLAMPLADPQANRFTLGGAATLKALVAVGPYLDVGPTVGFIGLPASDANPTSDLGTSLELGGGLRFKRAHEKGRWLGVIRPWIDVDALYVRTGSLDRFGFSVGGGLAFPLADDRKVWMGPFARYSEIVNPARGGFDDTDAKILILGVSLELDGGPRLPPETTAVADCPAVVALPAPECPPIAQLPDGDGDGVPDLYDRCPDVAGKVENQGCPPYEKIIVKADKLELKEHIQFGWDQAVIDPVSYPLLDEVVRALKENKSFSVRIEGHTSSDGQDDHNQALSDQRAQAVYDYLVSHGVAKERLSYKGFSSSEPLESNVTPQGREANRRVVFKVDLIILEKGSVE